MTITTLKASPNHVQETISLIEKAFHYEKSHHFCTDFAPLISEENHANCFIKLNESLQVIAHIGVREIELCGVKVAMLGGIAVNEKYRGEGHFQDLMQDVLAEKRSDVAAFILWSDQEKLYKRFGFHLCGSQVELPSLGQHSNYTQTKLTTLSPMHLEQLKSLYNSSFAQMYSTIKRNDRDWKTLASITSSDLFIKIENEKITDYFFMNKGQDLTGIIFEYGTTREFESFVQEISGYGKVWLGKPINETGEEQYQFFLSPGDTRLFSSFISNITLNQINIREVNPMKQEVYFDFKQELLGLEIEEFLRGVLGPHPFEELEMTSKPIFISGLESI